MVNNNNNNNNSARVYIHHDMINNNNNIIYLIAYIYLNYLFACILCYLLLFIITREGTIFVSIFAHIDYYMI